MGNTKIEWATKVWNPITGCTPVSEGCRNCYARRMAGRLNGRYGYPESTPFAVTYHPERLKEPLAWKKPQRVFVCSMGDFFHEKVSLFWVPDVLDIIYKCPKHLFMFLTKRPENARDWGFTQWPNIWLDVSVENQEAAEKRIPKLLEIPAAKHFISYEPALGPVSFLKWRLDWIIAGGETGPGARPAHPDWFRQVRDDCQEAGVPFFFKGMGSANGPKTRL